MERFFGAAKSFAALFRDRRGMSTRDYGVFAALVGSAFLGSLKGLDMLIKLQSIV